MARFVEIEERYVNVESIVSIVDYGEMVTIWHSSGDCRQVSTSYVDEIIGRNHIAQITPVTTPLVAIYHSGARAIVTHLALTASGDVRPLGLIGGGCGFLDEYDFMNLTHSTALNPSN